MRDNPREEEHPVSDLQASVLGLLEDAGVDQRTNDRIMELIQAAERRQYLEAGMKDHPFSHADGASALDEIARCLDGAWEPRDVSLSDYQDNYLVRSFMDAVATLADSVGLPDSDAIVNSYRRMVTSSGVGGFSYDTPMDALPEIAEALEGAWEAGTDVDGNWVARAFMVAVGTLRLHERNIPGSVLDAYCFLLSSVEPSDAMRPA